MKVACYQLILFLLVANALSACAPRFHSSAMLSVDAIENFKTPETHGSTLNQAPATIASSSPGKTEPKAIAANSPHVPNMTAAPRLVIPAWLGQSQGETWTKFTITALAELGSELLAAPLSDSADYCPNYNNLVKVERAKVWLALISGIVLFESSFRPAAFFMEEFKTNSNQRVISRGLMQISRESANLYGCGIGKETELEDPETNIRCGIRILSRLVTTERRLRGGTERLMNNSKVVEWHGAARYWSVLRANRKDDAIRATVASMSQCR